MRRERKIGTNNLEREGGEGKERREGEERKKGEGELMSIKENENNK